MIVEIILAIILPLLFYIIINYVSHLMKLKDYPPGPFPLPIIGNLHLLSAKSYIDLTNLAKQYGDVFSLSFGMERIVIINTIEPAREALIEKGSLFAGRPNNYTAEFVSRGYKDIAFTDGPVWKLARKIVHSSLKMYGDGLNKLEKLVVLEREDLHSRFIELDGNATDLNYELGLSVLNVMASVVFGKRYKKDNPEFKQIIDFNNLIVSGLGQSDATTFIPWLRFFPLSGMRNLRKGISLKDEIIRRKHLEHKKTFDGENVRDFMDSLLKVSKEETKLGKEAFTADHLEMIITNVIIAGSETTLTTLRWCILYLMHWPKYQDMLYKEIITVVGTDQYPDMKHKSSLHLLQATINETLRFSSLTPFTILHKSAQKSEISNVPIPKDANVLFNLWHIHHDEREWKNPYEFYPERWLDESGNFSTGIKKSYLPFSAGRRVCLGESLAKLELHTFLSHMIRDFTFEMAAGVPLPSLDGVFGLTLSPVPFECVPKLRSNVIIKNKTP